MPHYTTQIFYDVSPILIKYTYGSNRACVYSNGILYRLYALHTFEIFDSESNEYKLQSCACMHTYQQNSVGRIKINKIQNTEYGIRLEQTISKILCTLNELYSNAIHSGFSFLFFLTFEFLLSTLIRLLHNILSNSFIDDCCRSYCWMMIIRAKRESHTLFFSAFCIFCLWTFYFCFVWF